MKKLLVFPLILLLASCAGMRDLAGTGAQTGLDDWATGGTFTAAQASTVKNTADAADAQATTNDGRLDDIEGVEGIIIMESGVPSAADSADIGGLFTGSDDYLKADGTTGSINDDNAIHVDTAAEISAVAQEGSALESDDVIIGEDAQNSYAKIRIHVSELDTYFQASLFSTYPDIDTDDTDDATMSSDDGELLFDSSGVATGLEEWTVSGQVISMGENAELDGIESIDIEDIDKYQVDSAPLREAIEHEKCFIDVDVDAGNDDRKLLYVVNGLTVDWMRCYAADGTSVQIILSDGTNALDTMTCDTDGAVDDGTISNASFSSGEWVEYDTGTVTGTTEVTFCFGYSEDIP